MAGNQSLWEELSALVERVRLHKNDLAKLVTATADPSAEPGTTAFLPIAKSLAASSSSLVVLSKRVSAASSKHTDLRGTLVTRSQAVGQAVLQLLRVVKRCVFNPRSNLARAEARSQGLAPATTALALLVQAIRQLNRATSSVAVSHRVAKLDGANATAQKPGRRAGQGPGVRASVNVGHLQRKRNHVDRPGALARASAPGPALVDPVPQVAQHLLVRMKRWRRMVTGDLADFDVVSRELIQNTTTLLEAAAPARIGSAGDELRVALRDAVRAAQAVRSLRNEVADPGEVSEAALDAAVSTCVACVRRLLRLHMGEERASKRNSPKHTPPQKKPVAQSEEAMSPSHGAATEDQVHDGDDEEEEEPMVEPCPCVASVVSLNVPETAMQCGLFTDGDACTVSMPAAKEAKVGPLPIAVGNPRLSRGWRHSGFVDVDPSPVRAETTRTRRISVGQRRSMVGRKDAPTTKYPLHRAARAGDVASCHKMLASCPDDSLVRKQDDFGDTVLHVAITSDHVELAGILLGYNADPFALNNAGVSPLQLAAKGNMTSLLEHMLSNMPMQEPVSANDGSAATNAVPNPILAMLRHPATPELLMLCCGFLAKGFDVNAADKWGDCIIHLVAAKGWHDMMEVLLGHPLIDVHRRNRYDETCLHKAARTGNLNMVRLLVGAGVDPAVEGVHGTALDLASEPDVCKLLERVTPKREPTVEEDDDAAVAAAAAAAAAVHEDTDSSDTVESHADDGMGRERTGTVSAHSARLYGSSSMRRMRETNLVPSARSGMHDGLTRLGLLARANTMRPGLAAPAAVRGTRPAAATLAGGRPAARTGATEQQPSGHDVQQPPPQEEPQQQPRRDSVAEADGLPEELRRKLTVEMAAVCRGLEALGSVFDEMEESSFEDANADPTQRPGRSATLRRQAELDKHGMFAPYAGNVYELETGTPGVSSPELFLDSEIEPYRTSFFPKSHWNYATRSHKGQKGTLAIMSVLRLAKEGVHKALLTSGRGQFPVKCPDSELPELVAAKRKRKKAPQGEEERIRLWLESVYDPGSKWKLIPQKVFNLELLGLEAAHSQNARCFRIGVVFGQPGQTSEADMFANTEGSPALESFMESLGDRIQVAGWSGFGGGFGPQDDGDTFYTSWKGMEVMFHVSTMCSPEQQRRLIGNDIALIYVQSDTAFVPDFRGSVNSVAIVVRPEVTAKGQPAYRLASFRRANVCAYPPDLPEDPVFLDPGRLKEFVLTKSINGILAAHRSPPLDQLYARLYQSEVKEILDTYL